MEDFPSELNKENLEVFLCNDGAFVDYFNTFLSLPCFPERIFYNKESDLLEQFTQQLVKDEDDDVQLKYDSSSNKVQISYCVTVLERDKALEWLKKYRLPEFFKSGLYAEYKLSRTLSPAQAIYIDTIKSDLSRSKSRDAGERFFKSENSKSPEDDFFRGHSVSSTSAESDVAEIEEILNDYETTNNETSNNEVPSSVHSSNTSTAVSAADIRDPKKAENTRTKMRNNNDKFFGTPSIFAENFSECLPSIIVNEIVGNAGLTIRDREETSESSVTSDDFNETSSTRDFSRNVGKRNDYATSVDDSSGDIVASSVRDYDVIGDDFIGNDVIGDDVISDDVMGDDVIGDDGISDDVIGDNNVTTQEVFGLENKQLSDGLPFPRKHTELRLPEDNSNKPQDKSNTSSECSENPTRKTRRKSSLSRVIATDNSTDKQKELETEKYLRKNKMKPCKCFHGSDKVSEKKLHNKYEDSGFSFKNETNVSNMSRSDKHSKENCTNVSKDRSRETDVDNFAKGLDTSSFVSKIPVSASALNTVEQCSLNEQNAESESELKGSKSDTLASLEVKSYTIGSLQARSLQNEDDIKSMNASTNYTYENMDHKLPHEGNATVDNIENLSSDVRLSKKIRTSHITDSNGNFGDNKMPQEGSSTTVHNLNILSSDIKFPYIGRTSHFTESDGNINDNKMPQEFTNTTVHDSLELSSSDIKLSNVDDVASRITDGESEPNSSDRSFRKRTSSLTSIASSDISVELGRKSNDVGKEDGKMLDSDVNLAYKTGMDKFKEFLLNTKGEALLLFWLQVETWKHLGNNGDKIRVLQEMKDQYLRSGSPLELPDELKKQAGCFGDDLSETQRIIAEPLRRYWCPRFTLHQFKSQTQDGSEQSELEEKSGQKSWSSDVQPKSSVPGLMFPSTSPHLLRPHSSTPRAISHSSTPRESLHSSTSRETLHSSSPRETLKAGKAHARSKSAHGRMVTTPCHTNAGKNQLELYATPQPAQFGFQKRAISAFPPCNDQDYLSPVRLIITPRCKPKSRTAWPQRQEENKTTDQTCFSKPRDSVRQDSLVDSLTYQTESGCFFKEFVSKQNNQLWLNCLSFWQAVMDYTTCFESDTLNPVTVSRKAQWIFARFITSGSVCDIKVDWITQDDIRRKLDPPFEELFDCVEDHVLKCLKEPWDNLCRNERREYDVIPKMEAVRFLEVNLKPTRGRSKISFLQEELESQEGREHSERGKYSMEEANHALPVPQDGVSFETVIKDRDELEGFQKYMEKKDPKGVMDLMAWTDMETFQRIPRAIEEKRNKKAKEIRQGYLNSRYFFGPDSPATKEAQNLILSMNGSPRIKERPSSSVITECQKYVRCRIERRWLALYKASEEYRERQNPKQNVSDVVEDIMLRRRLQRSEAAWRVLNGRWVSSSRDIVALRQTLSNPESCLAFRRFVALKGDTYENDVLFWIEIQKYKDLCHRHASEQCIKKKIQAITECFITSSIPPELQVDVPIEMAEKLVERITSRNQNIGPYLFREVQMTVFRVLFNMWKDFSTFRSSINDENLLKVLEKRLQQHRAEVRAKKEAHERKKFAKQEAEKKRKEKEEKEKKELKSMEQLMSLMTENTSWEQEENDVVLWKYSKHMAACSEPTSRQKKVSTQDDTASFIELTNQKSVATKSTNPITTSLKSERITRKVSKSRRVGSLLADSTYSTHSKHSMKETNSTTSRIPRIHVAIRNSKAHAIERYDIIDKNSPETEDNPDKKQSNAVKNKLLKNRERKKSKKIIDQEVIVAETGNKHDSRVKSPGIKDSGLKSRKKNSFMMEQRDTSAVSERPRSLRTSVLRQQWNESHDRNRSPVPLTSQLLKDFTNSPEGAPLDTPLSLVRINKSDDVSVGKVSDIPRKTTPISISKHFKESNIMSWRGKKSKLRLRETEQFVPDVIVN